MFERHLRLAALQLILAPAVLSCTTMIFGRNATAPGVGLLVTYGSDAHGTPDSRLVRIPPTTNAPGDKRPVYPDTEDYPRYVGTERGAKEYFPKKGQSPTAPIGSIPQAGRAALSPQRSDRPVGLALFTRPAAMTVSARAAHHALSIEKVPKTHGYYETSYGVINDGGLAIGESSCSARLFGSPARGAIFSIDALSRIAMERASTAREAILLIGALAEEHGFFGVTRYPAAGPMPPYPCPRGGSNEGGETLSIADADEGWILHMLSDGGRGAIWAARRVADDEVTTCSNMFTIREVSLSDPANFLFSKSMTSVAAAKGWWKVGEPFDFTAIYSGGEYHHKYYSGRRVWRALSLAAPSLQLSPWYNDTTLLQTAVYPWSVKPDVPQTLESARAIMRDVYQGTQFDLTKSPSGGAHGTPARFDHPEASPAAGAFERSISVFRTQFSYVVQLRRWLSLPMRTRVHYAPHSAIGSVYLPLYCGMNEIPRPFSVGNPSELDKTSAWWTFRYVTNIAYGMRWSSTGAVIRKAQAAAEQGALAALDALEAKVLAGASSVTELYEATAAIANDTLNTWWSLPDQLVFSFADGYINNATVYGVKDPNIYPDWWRAEVGYQNGPGWGPGEN